MRCYITTVTVDEALALLGVTPDADGRAIKRAYRVAARRLHPDRPDAPADAHERMTLLNEAYDVAAALLSGASDQAARPSDPAAHTPAATAEPPSGQRHSSGRAATVAADTGVHLDVDGTLLVEAPPDETFMVLVEAAERLGEVTYVDRSSGLLQILIDQIGDQIVDQIGDQSADQSGRPGQPTERSSSSYVTFSLQGRALNTEIFVTIESIDGRPPLPVQPVLEVLAELIADVLR